MSIAGMRTSAAKSARPVPELCARSRCEACPIRAITACAGVPESQSYALETASLCRRVEAGGSIVRQGDPAKWLVVLRKGQARTVVDRADGRRQITQFLVPGDVFGFPDDVYGFSAEAITACELCFFDRARLQALAGRFPEFAFALAEREAQELDRMRAHMFILGRMSAREKVAALLADFAKRQGGDVIRLPATRTETADHLGLTLETVSRTMTSLARDKIIRSLSAKRIQVLDPDRLAAAIDGG